MTCPDLEDLERYTAGELEPAVRGSILTHLGTCIECSRLVGEVKSNLDFGQRVRGALTQPAYPVPPVSDGLPEIAGYIVRAEIGRGGMGVVYEAHQIDPPRPVAIKLFVRGAESSDYGFRLFRREAEVLARLRHPAIASVIDAGHTRDGRRYFAMDLIRGVALHDYVDREKLSLRSRLELFRSICDAVHHAHQRGVLHRDLKPANVLVESDGSPKVLDFGLARIVDSDAVSTLLTEPGRIQGTLRYMSPEQAAGRSQDVDVRSDVYSLGIMLYELLTGAAPYEVSGENLIESLRTICEVEPRRPRSINTTLPPDLEAILLKALEKASERRYASVNQLAEDITRFLTDQPIMARAPTVMYQIGKFARRHRTLVTGGAIAAVALLVAAAVATWQAVRASNAEEVARKRQTFAETQQMAAETARDAERLERYAAEMNLAFSAWEDADLHWARTLLANQQSAATEQEADLRGFEWHCLRKLTAGTHRAVPAHLAPINCAAFSPSGDLLASGGWDGYVRLWDPRTWHTSRILDGHRRAIGALAFSPDGSRLATAGWDGTVQGWDVASGSQLFSIIVPEAQPMAVAFSRDGARIAVATARVNSRWWPTATTPTRILGDAGPGQLVIYDAQHGDEIWRLRSVTRGFVSVAFSEDDRQLAAGSMEGPVWLIDWVGGQEPPGLAMSFRPIWSVAFIPGTDLLACAGGGWDQPAPIHVWDTSSRSLVATLNGHEGGVTALSVSSDGRELLSSGWDRTVVRWEVATMSLKQRLRGANGRLWSVALHPDLTTIAAAGYDGQLYVWQTDESESEFRMPLVRTEPYNSVAHSGDGTLLATVVERGFITVLDAATLQRVSKPQGHSRTIRALAFSPDSQILASGGHSGEIRLWNPRDGRRLAEFTGHKSLIWSLAFSPDGSRLYSAAGRWFGDGEFIAWQVSDGSVLHRIDLERRPEHRLNETFRGLDVSPDGTLVALAVNINAQPGMIQVLSTADWSVRCVLRGHEREINAVRFHPGEPILISGDVGGVIRVWDLTTGATRAILRGHSAEVTSLALSPDGRTLASAGVDGSVHLWQPSIAKPLGRLKAGDDNLWSLSFSPDGKSLAAALERALVVWNHATPPEEHPAIPDVPLFPVEHPAAPGTASPIEVQWQLSWKVLTAPGLSPEWYQIALDNALRWSIQAQRDWHWDLAVAAGRWRLGQYVEAVECLERIEQGEQPPAGIRDVIVRSRELTAPDARSTTVQAEVTTRGASAGTDDVEIAPAVREFRETVLEAHAAGARP